MNLLGGLVKSTVISALESISQDSPVENPTSGGFVWTSPMDHENTFSHPSCVLHEAVPVIGTSTPSHENFRALLSLMELDIWLAANLDQIS